MHVFASTYPREQREVLGHGREYDDCMSSNPFHQMVQRNPAIYIESQRSHVI